MKMEKSTWIAVILLIVASALSRILTFHIAGLAPQIAIALFGGAVIKDKKLAFALPVLSLLLSDAIMQLLYLNGMVDRAGFYTGQWTVYLSFAAVVVFGFLMKKINVPNVLLFSITGSILFFLASNFFVWNGGGGLGRPHTFNGLLWCYQDGLAYYRDYGVIKGFLGNFLIGDLIWSSALFAGFYFLAKPAVPKQQVSW